MTPPTPARLRVLVTGGNGFIGRNLCRHLADAGHTPVVLSRHPPTHPPHPSILFRPGDILRNVGLAQACEDCHAVIHLVGIIAQVGPQSFQAVHTEGTRHILNAAQAAGIRRFLHMSALGTRPGATSTYHQTKWAAEALVRETRLDWTIFRPSLVYGPEDLFTRQLASLTRLLPVAPVPGPGRGLLQPIDVDSVSLAFTRALSLPRTFGRIYDLCGPDRLPFRDVVDTLMKVLGRRRPRLHLPLAVARPAAAALEYICGRLLGIRPPLNRDQIVMLGEDAPGDAGPARRDLDINPPSFEQGLRQCLGPFLGR